MCGDNNNNYYMCEKNTSIGPRLGSMPLDQLASQL